MKKMQMIMAVLVLSGSLLAQGCALVSKQTAGDITTISLLTVQDTAVADPPYMFSFYDGNAAEPAFSLIQLFETRKNASSCE